MGLGEKQDGKQVLSYAQNPLIAVGFLSISLGSAEKHAKLRLEVLRACCTFAGPGSVIPRFLPAPIAFDSSVLLPVSCVTSPTIVCLLLQRLCDGELDVFPWTEFFNC